MDKNTILLDLIDYNRLRDFRSKIEDGYSIKIRGGCSYFTILTTEEAIKEIADENKKLYEINKELQDKLNPPAKKLQDKLNPPAKKELTTTQLKQMTFLQLIKWWYKK